jgi:hypothetical protein
MNAAEVLAMARAAGLCLAVDGAELVLEASGPPPPAVLDLVQAHKAEIIAAISAANARLPPSPAAVAEYFARRRSVISRFGGGELRFNEALWNEICDRGNLTASQKIDDAVVDWRDWYEERAAIRQFEGGYSREEAERLAKGEAEDRWRRGHMGQERRLIPPRARGA